MTGDDAGLETKAETNCESLDDPPWVHRDPVRGAAGKLKSHTVAVS